MSNAGLEFVVFVKGQDAMHLRLNAENLAWELLEITLQLSGIKVSEKNVFLLCKTRRRQNYNVLFRNKISRGRFSGKDVSLMCKHPRKQK